MDPSGKKSWCSEIATTRELYDDCRGLVGEELLDEDGV